MAGVLKLDTALISKRKKIDLRSNEGLSFFFYRLSYNLFQINLDCPLCHLNIFLKFTYNNATNILGLLICWKFN